MNILTLYILCYTANIGEEHAPQCVGPSQILVSHIASMVFQPPPEWSGMLRQLTADEAAGKLWLITGEIDDDEDDDG